MFHDLPLSILSLSQTTRHNLKSVLPLSLERSSHARSPNRLGQVEVNHNTSVLVSDFDSHVSVIDFPTYPATCPFLSFWTASLNLLNPTTAGSRWSLPVAVSSLDTSSSLHEHTHLVWQSPTSRRCRLSC